MGASGRLEADPAIARVPTPTSRRGLTLVANGGDPGPETPWGELKVSTGSGCGDPPPAPRMIPHAGAVTVRTEAGPLCEVHVVPQTDPVRGSLTLKASLERPMLLGDGPVYVVLTYHAADRTGWARGRLRASVNDGLTFFDWLGADGSPGTIRVPVPVADILMANELKLWFELEGRAQPKGSERLVLDAVLIETE